MGSSPQPSRVAFAVALIGLGILGLIYGNSAAIWGTIPNSLPGRSVLIYCCAVIELATGIGLLLRPSILFACRVLFPFLLLWLVMLKLPGLLLHPLVAVRWEQFGETAAILAGAWCLFALHAGNWEQRHLPFAVGGSGIRMARILLIAALPMFGVAHFVYDDLTASLVPTWLHFPLGWTYLTGAASLAAAAGMLSGIYPRLAVNLEAAMLWIFTLFVWGPKIVATSNDQGIWTEFLISAAIAAGVWLVADTYRGVSWLATGRAARVNPGQART
jgi:uncharacterized membrane protein